MKLLRLDAKGLRHDEDEVDIDLTIHPQMTVVLGAAGALRDTLIEAIAGIPKGVAATGGMIEVGGVHETLSEESLARLGLKADLDVVVRATDLPGHDAAIDERATARRAATDTLESVREALARAEADVEAKRRAHDGAVAAREEVRAGRGRAASVVESVAAARAEAAADLESAAAERTRLDADAERLRSERDASRAARDRAEQLLREATKREGTPAAEASDAQLRREDLQRRIALLAAQDPAEVLACLGRVETARTADPVPIPAALAFADAWRDLHQQLGSLDRSETDEEREARTKLDAAKRAAIEAERDLRVSALEPTMVAALEAAHNAVLEAQEKTNSRFSGTRARIRLDQLRAVERNALEQLGFSSYADYMMSSSSRGVGAGKRAVLQAARIRVAEADAEWQALGGDASRDMWRTELLEQRSAIAPRIALLLGHEPEGPDVERELRELRAVPPADPVLIGQLRAALLRVGLEVGEEDLGQEELLRLARGWLDENAHLATRRAELEAELRSSGRTPTEVSSDPMAPEPSNRPVVSSEQARRQLADAARDLNRLDSALADTEQGRTGVLERESAARARLEAIDAPEGGVEGALRSLLTEAEEQVERAAEELTAAAQAVERWQADLVQAEERLSAVLEAEQTTEAAGDAPGEDREELIEEIEWYLLARLAAQRAVGGAGSVPLVLDDTFRDLEVAETVRVMESVERMSGAVQVIAVSNDRALSFWAEALGEERAGVVTLGD